MHIADHLVNQRATPSPTPTDTPLKPRFLEAHNLVERLPVWRLALDELDWELSVPAMSIQEHERAYCITAGSDTGASDGKNVR